jgi:hypothetical protein
MIKPSYFDCLGFSLRLLQVLCRFCQIVWFLLREPISARSAARRFHFTPIEDMYRTCLGAHLSHWNQGNDPRKKSTGNVRPWDWPKVLGADGTNWVTLYEYIAPSWWRTNRIKPLGQNRHGLKFTFGRLFCHPLHRLYIHEYLIYTTQACDMQWSHRITL